MPLAMSTLCVCRAADGTEVCLFFVSVSCEGNELFDSSSDVGAI